MRRDPEVAYAGIHRQHEVERRGLPAGSPALLEHVSDGGGAARPAGEGLGERRIESGGADLIEQAQQARGLTGERLAPDGEGVEEGARVPAGVAEAVAAAEVVRVALLSDECGEMGFVFDALPAIVAARMAGDLGWCRRAGGPGVRRRRE